jgi:hypothetical protein
MTSSRSAPAIPDLAPERFDAFSEPVDPDIMGFTCEHNKAPGRAPEAHGLLDILTTTAFATRS